MTSHKSPAWWRQQEQQDQAIIQKYFTSALTPVPGMVLPQVKALLPLPPPHVGLELNSFEQVFCHFWLISCRPPEKTQGKEISVWAVNKMEQSKAALCPVPNLCLTWTSKFLFWHFTLVQLLLAGTELQNEMKITWLHFRRSVSRLLLMQ